MKNLIFGLALLLVGAPSGFCASSSSSSKEDEAKKAAEEARKRYEAMIQGLCAGMDGTIGTAEKQRDTIVEFARSFETVSETVKGAWDAMDAVYTEIDGANAANGQAKAMVQPEANLNNAGYLVQESRKDMFGVAQMLSMNTQELFGFNPPPNWDGSIKGEKPIQGLDPRGVLPGSGGGSGGSKPGDSFPPMTPGGTGGKTSGGGVPGGSGAEGGAGLAKTGGLSGTGGLHPAGGPESGDGAVAMLRGRSGTGGGLESGSAIGGGAFAFSNRGTSASPEGGASAAGRGGRSLALRERGLGGSEDLPGGPIEASGPGSSRGMAGMKGPMSRETSDAWRLNLAGRYTEAEAAARDAIRRDPNDNDAYEALAWAELRQGRFKDSERDATRAIALNGKSARAYRIRAFARQMLGDRVGMLRDIEKAAELDPDYEDELEIARRGGDIYDPSKGDEELLHHRKKQPLSRRDVRDFSLLLVGTVGAGLFALWLRRRKSRPVQVLSPDLQAVPALADSYELGKELGKARGSVVLAKDKALGRTAVIRRTRVPDPRERALLLAAGKAAARLDHPVWARIYAVSEEGEHVCMVCEHLLGRTLRDIAASGEVDPRRLVQALARACEPLPAAHAAGVSHGRLHLGNICVTEGGEVKVLDLGTVVHPAGAPQDVADLGRCLAELAAASKGPLPPGLEGLAARAASVKTAQEFVDLLKGA